MELLDNNLRILHTDRMEVEMTTYLYPRPRAPPRPYRIHTASLPR